MNWSSQVLLLPYALPQVLVHEPLEPLDSGYFLASFGNVPEFGENPTLTQNFVTRRTQNWDPGILDPEEHFSKSLK
jgi:hypothetical protein